MIEHGRPIACEARTAIRVPVFVCRVPAGFPSPADDYLDHPLDFNELLIAHPAATFAVRVAGESMIGVGHLSGRHRCRGPGYHRDRRRDHPWHLGWRVHGFVKDCAEIDAEVARP